MLTLAFALAFALYLNWNYSSAGGALPITDLVQQVSLTENEQKNYGDAKYVSANADYFAEVRLQRSQSRDIALEDLEAVLSQSTLSDADKDAAMEELSRIVSYGAMEASAESLIKAKGFSDCVVFVSESGVKVVVSASGLSDSDVAQITEIVIGETDMPAAAINIVEIN